MISIQILLFIFLAYLTGAIPFAVWIGKFFYGIDLRDFGSNNSGATNAFRVLGAKVGSDNIFEIPIFVDEEIYNIKIRYLGNELIETHWGFVDCMVFQPHMQEGRVFENEEEMKIWITDDKNRILVKAETVIWAGIIRAELNNYNNLKTPLKFLK